MIKLYQFPHSHFSEKARWGLTYKGVPFEIVNLPRGPHAKMFEKMGLAGSTVPVIEDGETLLQGSAAILSYLDQAYPDPPLNVADKQVASEIMAFEADMDQAIGHHGRRYIYSIFLEHPALIKDLFMRGAGPIKRAAFPLLYPKIKKLIVDKLQITDSATAESEQILTTAFERLNARLADREYLFGDTLTRADITAAALTSLFTWPPEHEFDFPDERALPQEVKDFRAGLADQRFYHWGQELYRTHRHKCGRGQ